ncbi:ABC transporter permease subunit [Nitrospinota bacterium]
MGGYDGGEADFLLVRLWGLVLSFPFTLIALAVIAIVGLGLLVLIVVMSLRIWVICARVIRGEVLPLRQEEFVQAAGAMGGSHVRDHLSPHPSQRSGSCRRCCIAFAGMDDHH